MVTSISVCNFLAARRGWQPFHSCACAFPWQTISQIWHMLLLQFWNTSQETQNYKVCRMLYHCRQYFPHYLVYSSSQYKREHKVLSASAGHVTDPLTLLSLYSLVTLIACLPI